MTYIAQNEYAALYVPARYLPQVNPRYAEVLMWLASHVHDEARHVEVFTKRALIGGSAGLRARLDRAVAPHAARRARLPRRGAAAERARRGHLPRPAALRRAARARRGDRARPHGSRTATSGATCTSAISHVRAPARARSRRAQRARRRGRGARREAHEPVGPEPAAQRGAHADGAPGRSSPPSSRRRAAGPRADADDGATTASAGCAPPASTSATARYLSDLHTPNLM